MSCQVVTCEGDVLEAGARENEDLFWALRGGGGSFGVVTSFKFEGRLYHWRQERRSPRVSAIYALFAMDRVPKGEGLLKAMLSESVHMATVIAQRVVPHRFPIAQWRLAASSAGGLAVAEPQIRALRQQCRERGWAGDTSTLAAEFELADIIRQLSGG